MIIFLGEDEEDTRSEVSADEESLPSTFSLGDLAWARVGQAPYWPCVITIDPDSKDKYTKVIKRHKAGFRRDYHLQFYGSRVQRAWVISSNMLKFEGLQAFNDLAQKVSKKQRLMAFKPKDAKTRVLWNEAIEACDLMLEKSNQDRLDEATKVWENKDKVAKTNVTASKKRRRESCESPLPGTNEPLSKKVKLFAEAEQLIEAIPIKVLDDNKRKLKTGFKLFQLAHKDDVKKTGGKFDYILLSIGSCLFTSAILLFRP